jgi:hypothetical protein
MQQIHGEGMDDSVASESIEPQGAFSSMTQSMASSSLPPTPSASTTKKTTTGRLSRLGARSRILTSSMPADIQDVTEQSNTPAPHARRDSGEMHVTASMSKTAPMYQESSKKTTVSNAIGRESATFERIANQAPLVASLIEQFSANKHFEFSATAGSGADNIRIWHLHKQNDAAIPNRKAEALSTGSAVEDANDGAQTRRRSSAAKSIDRFVHHAVSSIAENELECRSGAHNWTLDGQPKCMESPHEKDSCGKHRVDGAQRWSFPQSEDPSLDRAMKSVDQSELHYNYCKEMVPFEYKAEKIAQNPSTSFSLQFHSAAEMNNPVQLRKQQVIVFDFESMEPPARVRTQYTQVVKDLKELMKKANEERQNENHRRITERMFRELLETSKTWVLTKDGEENGPPNAVTVDEVSDIVTHFSLCEQTNTPIRWDLINDILFPEGAVDEPESQKETNKIFRSIRNEEKPNDHCLPTNIGDNMNGAANSQQKPQELTEILQQSGREGDAFDAFRTQYNVSEEEMAGVIAHLKLCEEKSTEVRWDLIHQIIHPEENMDKIRSLTSSPNDFISNSNDYRPVITEGLENESHASWFSIYPEFDDCASSVTFLMEDEAITVDNKRRAPKPVHDSKIKQVVDELDRPTLIPLDGNLGADEDRNSLGFSLTRHDIHDPLFRQQAQGSQKFISCPDQPNAKTCYVPPKKIRGLDNQHRLNRFLQSPHSCTVSVLTGETRRPDDGSFHALHVEEYRFVHGSCINEK